MATMRLEIITAESVIFSDDVEGLVAPGNQGELGILPQHAALMTALQGGEIAVRKQDGDVYLAVSGGFLEIVDNKVVILADTAEISGDIDESRARAAMTRAEDRLTSGSDEVDSVRATAALHRSQVRLKVSQRRNSSRSATSV